MHDHRPRRGLGATLDRAAGVLARYRVTVLYLSSAVLLGVVVETAVRR